MFFHHANHCRFVTTFTTSRCINAAPCHLVRILQLPSLFTPPAAKPQRPPPIAIDFNPAPNGRGAITLHCAQARISERRPIRTRYLSPARFTAETEGGTATRHAAEPPALALTIDLTPLVWPGPTIATRVTLYFHFVREPWWPRDLTDALNDLADLWLRRLDEQVHTTSQNHQTSERGRTTRPGPSLVSRRSRTRQVSETWHV